MPDRPAYAPLLLRPDAPAPPVLSPQSPSVRKG